MTDTTDIATQSAGESNNRGNLSSMKLDELKQVASKMGITGTSKMRKSDLLAAINGDRRPARQAPSIAAEQAADSSQAPAAEKPQTTEAVTSGRAEPKRSRRAESGTAAPEQAERPAAEPATDKKDKPEQQDSREERSSNDRSGNESKGEAGSEGERQGGRNRQGNQNSDGERQNNQNKNRDRQGGNDRNDRQGGSREDNRGNDNRGGNDRGNDNRGGNDRQGGNNNRQGGNRDDNDGRGRRRQRGRDRKRGRGREDFGDVDTQIREDDVLVPVAGILDILDNYGFVRTSGYLPGTNDVYVPMGMVKKNGMRKGDAVVGKIRAPREGEQPQQNSRQKFNALVQVDSVNGHTAEEAVARPEFGKLTPLYPQERLRLEDDQKHITNRMIDLVAPIGKGQRGLIVAPAKSGKTLVMQAIANAIAVNNPECHLMVVLVDERPEEVTDFQRSVKGEVIASTFDRPASDHTEVAELAIERAKRLVELGHDVVVLLDGITRLGRAYNLAAPASGRIMSGGVDSAALYPPKKFFGAARNIENGGSLTILATALIDSGSKMDEVIFEEFKGTGNWELRLSRQLAERRIFPAVDVNGSSTRREEILLGQDELKIMWKLRRVLAALDAQQGIELLLDRLKKTTSNAEFLMQVQQTSSIKLDDDED
ncbi:transcription termination factor Rho [Dermacoccaceae bacterium W4C1]